MQAREAQLLGLQQADARTARIFWRIATRNEPLCDDAVPAIGLLFHARSAYEGAYEVAAQHLFGFDGEVAVEAVMPDGPADRAGVHPDDTLLQIDGQPLSDAKGPAAVAAADSAIARAGADGVISLTLSHDGKRRHVSVVPQMACPGRVEVTVSASRAASTDGHVIQVSTGMLNSLPDDSLLAAVMAHEYSHLILNHPERLTAAHVDRGLLASFGKNRRLIRQTEKEADELSVYLMLNAGYSPMAAGMFWRTVGRKLDPGILSDGTHMGWRARAKLLDQEAAKAKASTSVPVIPPLLATRNTPLE